MSSNTITITTTREEAGSAVPSVPLGSTEGIALTGRWLHYGTTHKEPGLPEAIWSPAAWDVSCQQAKAWGMTGVHLKVADGDGFWYDEGTLAQLVTSANQHGLHFVPSQSTWGKTRGRLQGEAHVAATLGKHCGMVLLDLKAEWEGHPDWAQELGYSIRHSYGYSGPLLYTTFAQPENHPTFPYLQLNPWFSAWLPQVSFDLWSTTDGHPMTAKEAIDLVYPQWVALDQLSRSHGGGILKPILPVISLFARPAEQEVANWLRAMQGYGYCGFWSDESYGPYAQTVLASPKPALLPPPDPDTHQQSATPPVVVDIHPAGTTEAAPPVTAETPTQVVPALTPEQLATAKGAHEAAPGEANREEAPRQPLSSFFPFAEIHSITIAMEQGGITITTVAKK